jgi:hypothetical protein
MRGLWVIQGGISTAKRQQLATREHGAAFGRNQFQISDFGIRIEEKAVAKETTDRSWCCRFFNPQSAIRNPQLRVLTRRCRRAV